ncbi:MAG: helix-turn-helix transcriptional regulator [Pseudomonadota bacterium]
MPTDNIETVLKSLGLRLRRMRLERNDTQDAFAARIGISVPTLRAMENGDPGVRIGNWIEALRILGRLNDIDTVLEIRETLFDKFERSARVPARRRVSRKRSP